MARRKAPKRLAWLNELNTRAEEVLGLPAGPRKALPRLDAAVVEAGGDAAADAAEMTQAGQTFYVKHWTRRVVLPELVAGAQGRRTSKSGRLEQVCRRYDQMINAVTEHEFSVGDWIVFILALRKFDAAIEWLAWEQVMAWAEAYQDQARLNYGVDAKDSASRLQSAGIIANLQVLEFVERYWAETPSKAPFEDRLKLLGLFSDRAITDWRRHADAEIRLAEQELKREVQRGKEKPQG